MAKNLLILVVLLLINIPALAQSVDTVLVRRYNGPGNDLDYASDIAVDGSGNVYVTASSEYDYATIKYDPDGNELWLKIYPGLCGDLNYDGEINLSDPICLANYYFGKPCSIIAQASDVNCDSNVNLADAIIIAKYYFGYPGFELNCCP